MATNRLDSRNRVLISRNRWSENQRFSFNSGKSSLSRIGTKVALALDIMSKRILVVDDEEAILFSLRTYLGRLGFTVDCARDVAGAERLLLANRYDLFYADLRLTGTDTSEGLALITFARNLACPPRIIVLTAYGSAHINEEALHRGAEIVLQKPQPLAHLAQIGMSLLDIMQSPALPNNRAVVGREQTEIPMNKKKVLVVDDSNTTLLLHQMILSNRTPYQVITAHDGQEAVEQAIANRPDLILMDVVMPQMNGYEACREIRAREITRQIPVILVTTRGEEHSVENGYESGCNDYITKPVNPGELVALLNSYLG